MLKYEICYPYEDEARGKYSWEIDKVQGEFFTIGHKVIDDNEEDYWLAKDCNSVDERGIVTGNDDGDCDDPKKERDSKMSPSEEVDTLQTSSEIRQE